MKKQKWFLPALALAVLVSLLLAGCGVAQEDYDAVVAERDSLLAERASLQAQMTELQTEKEALQSDYNALSANYTIAQEELESVEAAMEALQAQYDAVSAELSALEEICPPGSFPSDVALIAWLEDNPVSGLPPAETAEEWIEKALQVQADALADGYLVNMDYDYEEADETYFVFCTTIIDGRILFWDPETDNVTQDITLSLLETPASAGLQR